MTDTDQQHRRALSGRLVGHLPVGGGPGAMTPISTVLECGPSHRRKLSSRDKWPGGCSGARRLLAEWDRGLIG